MGSVQQSATMHSLGGNVPQEVLRYMLEQFDWVCSVLSSAASASHCALQQRSVRVLAAASGTCRAWFAICAPILYRRIRVTAYCGPSLVEVLSNPHNNIAQHARWLTIWGPKPWLVLHKLLELLPHLDELAFGGTIADPYHPSFPHLAHVMQIPPSVTSLIMRYQRPSSAAVVPLLLASLPQLSTAKLYDCTLEYTQSPFPRVSSTNLRQILIAHEIYEVGITEFAYVAQWWQWPHPATSSSVGPYPGLHRADSRGLCTMLKALCPVSDWWWVFLHLIPDDHTSLISLYSAVTISVERAQSSNRCTPLALPLCRQLLILPRTGVLLAKFRLESAIRDHLEVEVHVCSAPEAIGSFAVESAARITHIVIRLDPLRWEIEDAGYAKRIASFEDPLATLTHLEAVTLEAIEEEESARLVRRFPSFHKNGKLRRRTCEEAQRTARTALEDPAALAEGFDVLSPLWYSDEYSVRDRNQWCVGDPRAVTLSDQVLCLLTSVEVHRSIEREGLMYAPTGYHVLTF